MERSGRSGYFVSKCSCCSRGCIEDLDHLLVHSDIATHVWEYFGKACGVRCVSNQNLFARQGMW
ncbi:hypothetical protein GIB67_009706, partial [Kingdonia uniflora]